MPRVDGLKPSCAKRQAPSGQVPRALVRWRSRCVVETATMSNSQLTMPNSVSDIVCRSDDSFLLHPQLHRQYDMSWRLET